MIFLGYDPGGNDKHGVAALTVDAGRAISIDVQTLYSAELVLGWFLRGSQTPHAIGVDTLTLWGTGSGGLRPADRWLRERYPEVASSVMASNSLYGAMSVNGMAVLHSLREKHSAIVITETHPKVLFFRLFGSPYNFNESDDAKAKMNRLLEDQLGAPVKCQTDHEWDAAISALAAFRWHSKEWSKDLHALPWSHGERAVFPCGPTNYAWPAI